MLLKKLFYFKAYLLCIFFLGNLQYSFSQVSPDDIADLQLWLRSDSLVDTTTTGSLVTQWNDGRGIPLFVDQSNSTFQPSIQYNAINGYPVIHFDGSDDFLGTSSSSSLELYSGGSIFVVFKSSDAVGGILSRGVDNGTYYGWVCSIGQWDAANSGCFFVFGSSGNAANATGTVIADGNFKIFEIIHSPVNGTDLYLNSNFLVNHAYVPIGTTVSDFFIAKGIGGNGFNYTSVDIAEIIIFNRAITNNERLQIETYLANKYAGPLVNLGPDITVPYGFCDTILDAGSGFASYLWSTGSTSQTISVDSSGSYSVTVTDTVFGFTSKDTVSVSFPQINLHDTLFCSNSNVVLSTGLIGSYTYNWTGGLTTPTINVSTPGNYAVTVTDGSSCTMASPVITVNVDSFPSKASLGPNISLCVGNSIGLISPVPLPGGLTYQWSNSASTPTISISTTDTYSVTVTDANSCSASDDIIATIVGTAPVIDFSYTLGCSGSPMQFTNLSLPSGDSLLWDFGDGDTSTSQNPIHTYASGNNYNVHLVVYDDICSNYLDSTIHVNESPVADFSSTTACINNTHSFYDQSTSTEGNINSWDWDFGDTTSHSNIADPQHIYSYAGNHYVTLIITTDAGCSDTVIKLQSVVNTAPSPDPFTLILPNDDFLTTGHNINFVWNTSGGAQTYRFEYSTNPSFTSNVTVISNLSTTSTTQIITTPQQYFWKVAAIGICGDSSVSTVRNFTIIDNTSIPGMQLWLMGASVDTANSKVTVWQDLSGNSNDVSQSNASFQPSYITSEPSIFNMPSIDFNGSSTYLSNTSPSSGITLNTGGSVFIVSKSSDNAGNIISKIDDNSPNYGWTAGLGWWSPPYEGNFFASGSASWAINSSGTTIATDTFNIYEIIHSATIGTSIFKNTIQTATGSYKAIDNNGGELYVAKGIVPNSNNYFNGKIAEIMIFDNALSTIDRNIIENYLHDKYAPPVNLGPDIWSYNLCADTIDASDRFINYLWNTGNTTSSIQVFSGDTIWVDVTDIFGFHSSDTVIVHKPIVLAHSDTLCYGDSATIHSGLFSPYTTAWAAGIDTSWNEAYTIHAGDTVNMVLQDTIGCTAVKQIIMTIDNFPLTDLLGASNLTICADDTIFAQNDTGQYVTYNWYDGTNNYNTPYFIVPSSWAGPGSGTLTLTCTNARGCTATDVVTVGVPGYMPDAAFSATSGCEPFTTQFTDQSTVQGSNVSFDQYLWNFGDGNTSIQQNPTHLFDTAGVHQVSLYVHTNKGCSATVVGTAFVYSKPDPAFSPLLGCTGLEMQFTDHSTSILGIVDSWTWDFNDPYSSNNTSTSQNPKHTFDSVGYYWVVLRDTTIYGCTAVDSQKIFIRPSPDVDFSYTNVCDGNPVYFTNETVDPLGIYQMHWDFGNGNIYTINNPVFTFDAAGTYPVVLVVQSINGCIVNDTQQVVVHALPEALLIPPDDICLGHAETLSDSSTVLAPDSITQWEWNFGTLGTFYSAHPVINFPAAGDYPLTLTVTSNAGCSGTFSTSVHVNPVPSAAFMPDEFYGEAPFTVTFTNNSTNGWNYLWNFGDSTTFSTFSISDLDHIFTYNDTFTVLLIVTNSYGCSDTASTELYIAHTTADVAVKNVTTQKQGDFLSVSADIANYGQQRIYELYLYAKTSGGTMFMESWSDFTHPLKPDSVMPYTFNAQFALPEGQNLDYVCVEAQIKNKIPDDNPLNNEECVTFNKNFTAFIPYPSPSHDEMSIDYILPFKDQVNIDLYDIRGRLVKHIFDGEGQKGLNKLTVDISDLDLAVYVYRIDFNDDFRILRFVKY